MQIYVLYRGLSNSDNHVRARLWYIYSLICSVRKTEIKHTSFREYYSHTWPIAFFIYFIWSCVERLNQETSVEKNRSKNIIVNQWSIWKKNAIFAIKNTALTKRLCTHPATTAPLFRSGRRVKSALLFGVATCHCQVMPSMLQLISHSFSPKLSSEAVLEQLAGAQSLSTHAHRGTHNGHYMLCCIWAKVW